MKVVRNIIDFHYHHSFNFLLKRNGEDQLNKKYQVSINDDDYMFFVESENFIIDCCNDHIAVFDKCGNIYIVEHQVFSSVKCSNLPKDINEHNFLINFVSDLD
jgi:hypothetical protein